jgi:hypothetical protein
MSLDFGETFAVAAVGGLAASAMNLVVRWLAHHHTETREARYLALRLAVIFEKYAIECAEAVAANELYLGSRGAAGDLTVSLPTLDAYPTDADWKALTTSLAVRALSVPNELVLATKAIDGEYVQGGHNADISVALDRQAGKTGYRAWQLAVDLRKKTGLPANDLSGHTWDFIATIKAEHDRAFRQFAAENRPS